MRREEQEYKLETFATIFSTLEENREKYPVANIIEDVEVIRKKLSTLPERVIKQMGQHAIKKIVDLGNEAVKDIINDGMKDLIKFLFFGEGVRQLLTHLHLLS